VADLLVGTEAGIRRLGDPGTVATLGGVAVRALSSDGSAWLAVTDRAAWRSDDANTWTEVATRPEGGIRCVAAGPAGRFVGLAEARLARLDGDAFVPVPSFDDVPGRSAWHTPWGGPPDVRSIAQDPEGAFVNVHVGGIPVSRDGGATWSPTVGIDVDVHQVIVGSEPGSVLAACARGLMVSLDGGRSWTTRTDGLHATYARAVAVSEDTVLVSASTGPRGGRAAVYRQPLDGSKPFERCAAGLPEWFDSNVDTFCLAASRSQVALGTDDGDVYRSDDRGATWERVAWALPAVTCLAFA
jgi:hypothetical protein